jgi:hypothetical protein
VLGLGLIAFGLISVAVLFPVGLRTNQAAVGETYAAQHAEQFLHVMKAKITSPDNDQANWAAYAQTFPTTKPGENEPASEWKSWVQQDVVTYKTKGDEKQFYLVKQTGPDGEQLQFSAVCRVWRSPVVIGHYEDGSWQEVTFPSSEAIGLNVEISWPADMPYAGRQKSLYQLEVYRPEL